MGSAGDGSGGSGVSGGGAGAAVGAGAGEGPAENPQGGGAGADAGGADDGAAHDLGALSPEEREAVERLRGLRPGSAGMLAPTARKGIRELDPEAFKAWRRIEQWEFSQKLGVSGQGVAFTDFIAVIKYLLNRVEALGGPAIRQ